MKIEESVVLSDVASQVLSTGATEFEVEYKDGNEHVFAFQGPQGIEIATFQSSSREAEDLRERLYAVKKSPRKVVHEAGEYRLRVKVYDSFGEDAFRIELKKAD